MAKSMKEQFRFIFDMDGTLYRFDKGRAESFTASRFSDDLKKNVCRFFMNNRGFSKEKATAEYERIRQKYNGEISLGVEKEYGINRYEYFEKTWNLNPQDYLEKDADLPKMLEELKGRIALLTAAPRIWAVNVLAFLDLNRLFMEKLYTGEPDERKPDTAVFRRIAADFKVSPEQIFSIGDQEKTDIIPAKNIGMKTVLIGNSQTTTADYQASDLKLAMAILKKEGFI